MKIIPVIHYKYNSPDLAIANATLAFKLGCPAVFLISMDYTRDRDLIPLAKRIKELFSDKQVGINLLGSSAYESVVKSIEAGLDATWSDYPVITSTEYKADATLIKNIVDDTDHLFFTSCAFKYQLIEHFPEDAAVNCTKFNFIPTTSGPATGEPADINKIKNMVERLNSFRVGFQPLAVASGLTPENVTEYADAGVAYGLVATGISEDFWTFSEDKLARLLYNLVLA